MVKTQTAPAGSGCTLQTYGATKLDLKGAKVGFSESEPDAAAFRAAETTSIKAEAKGSRWINLVSGLRAATVVLWRIWRSRWRVGSRCCGRI